MAELITGRELCDLFRIEYESIVSHRLKDQHANLQYIAHQLLAIEGIREIVLGWIQASKGTLLSSGDRLSSDAMTTQPPLASTTTPTPDRLGI